MNRRVAVVALGLLALSSAPGVVSAQPVADTVVVAQGGMDETLDPGMVASRAGLNVATHIYDLLVMRDDAGKIQPALAESYRSVNSTTWEFRLRRNVKFHDGEPFDAQAVKFSVERVLRLTGSQAGVYAKGIKEIRIVDPYTVHVVSERPDPTLIERMQMIPIGPKKYIEDKGEAHIATNPNGTGPYKLVRWVKGDRVVLEANDGHWRGKPAIRRLIFRVIPEPASMVASLQAGEVDLITNLSPDLANSLKRQAGIRVLTAPSQRTIMILLDTTIESPLKDRRVRQALNHAVNVDAIIEHVLLGYAKRVPTMLAPLYVGYKADLKAYRYDPARARALLKEAGYPQGFTVKFKAPVARYVKDKEVVETLVAQLNDVGVKFDLELMPWSNLVALWRKHGLGPAFYIGYGTPIWDSSSGFDLYLRCGVFSSYHCNKEFDGLVDQAKATIDEAARTQIYHKANDLIYNDPPMIYLYQLEDIYGVRDRLDWKARSDETIWLFNTTLKR